MDAVGCVLFGVCYLTIADSCCCLLFVVCCLVIRVCRRLLVVWCVLFDVHRLALFAVCRVVLEICCLVCGVYVCGLPFVGGCCVLPAVR